MKHFFFLGTGQSSTDLTSEKREQQDVIYDHADFLSAGNFQINMPAKSSGFTVVRRQKSEFGGS